MASGAPAIAPPPVPADIGIVVAMPMEISPFLARLKNVRKYAGERQTVVEGELGGKIIAVLVAGVGRKAAAKGTRLLVSGHRPLWIVSAGYGGALNPSYRRNQIVLPDEILDPEGNRLAVPVTLPESSEARPRLVTGRLLTVDHIVRTAAEKAELRAGHHDADLIDMESSAVAAVCAERGVKFLGVRIISDDAGVDLPPEILTILGPSGGFRVGAAVGALWRRPSALKELLVLREHANHASRKLGEALPAILSRLE